MNAKKVSPIRVPLATLRNAEKLKRFVDQLPIDAAIEVSALKKLVIYNTIQQNISQILFPALLWSSLVWDDVGEIYTFVKKSIPADIRNRLNREISAKIENGHLRLKTGFLQNKLHHILSHVRNGERDREIVRLHDVDHVSWKAMPRELAKLKPEWIITQGAARQAYSRYKSRPAKRSHTSQKIV